MIFSRGGMGTELKRWVSVLWVKVGVHLNFNMKLETRNYPVLPRLLAALSVPTVDGFAAESYHRVADGGRLPKGPLKTSCEAPKSDDAMVFEKSHTGR